MNIFTRLSFCDFLSLGLSNIHNYCSDLNFHLSMFSQK